MHVETAKIGNTACLGSSAPAGKAYSPTPDPSSIETAPSHELWLEFSAEHSAPGGELNSSIKCFVSWTLHKDAPDWLPTVADFWDSQDLVWFFFSQHVSKGREDEVGIGILYTHGTSINLSSIIDSQIGHCKNAVWGRLCASVILALRRQKQEGGKVQGQSVLETAIVRPCLKKRKEKYDERFFFFFHWLFYMLFSFPWVV